MEPTDPVMAEIMAAVQRHQQGDNAVAGEQFERLWHRIGPDGDPLHRCTVAHYMADVVTEPAEKLHWDSRALAAADSLPQRRAERFDASLQVRGFYPSLHLNLAQDHLLLGDAERAREHVALARAALPELPAGGYASTIGSALDRIDGRIAELTARGPGR